MNDRYGKLVNFLLVINTSSVLLYTIPSKVMAHMYCEALHSDSEVNDRVVPFSFSKTVPLFDHS